jgi:DNA-directed RNA polymerase III subunit RPC6
MASAGGSSRSIAAIAAELYEACRTKFPADYLFYQQDLLKLGLIPDNDLALLLQCTQSLVDQNLFRTLQDKDDRLAWKIISQEDAER